MAALTVAVVATMAVTNGAGAAVPPIVFAPAVNSATADTSGPDRAHRRRRWPTSTPTGASTSW